MYTPEEFDKEKIRVLKYVLYKRRTKYEIKTKFKNVLEENLLEDIIEYLINAEYINDDEYIKKAIDNFKALNNLSLKEIKYKLFTKGLDKNKIEDYISENKEQLQEYEIKSAKNLIYKKSISMNEEEIVQFLLKKGYLSENIKEALEE